MPAPEALLAADFAAPADLLQALLELSLASVVLYTPVYSSGGEVVDFAFVYLNPAAQHLLALPARPEGITYRQHFPRSSENGGFAFHQAAFASGLAEHFDVTYYTGGYDCHCQVVARRVGEGLLVNFTALATDEARPAVETALRLSQAREQQARLAAERERNLLQALNEVLQTTNDALQITNNELLLANAELTKTQQQLAAERERLKQVFAKTPALVAQLHGPHHTIAYANPAFQNFFADVPLLGRAYAAALPDVYAQGHGAWLKKVYATGEAHVGSEQLLLIPASQASERLVYLDFMYEAYGTPSPEDIFLLAFDVTEQVLSRRQHAANQQLRAVFEQAPVAISILQGPRYLIEVANPFIVDMWGRSVENLLNQPFFEMLPELREQGFEQVLAEVRRTGEPYMAQEVEARFWRFGKLDVLYVNLSIYPLRDEQGQVMGLVLISTDVSAQLVARRREQEFAEELTVMNEELQSANDELGTTNAQLTRTNVDLDNFIYTASHDPKAPITNIEGLLLALQSELPPASQTGEVAYIVSLMRDSVNRFKRTIEHLTDVSKLQKEHGQGVASVRLAEVIENVCFDLAPLIKETEAQLSIDVSSFVTLTFSEKNLRSVVYNLLSNALKYRHPSRVPHVRLLSRPQGAHLALEVQDNGLGLDLAREQGLFAMFQRYHTHVEGSGIGLYMVKKIVENAGGRIEVESKLGHGSTFFVYLPR